MCVICEQSNCLFEEGINGVEVVGNASSSEVTVAAGASDYPTSDLVDGITSPYTWTGATVLTYGFTSGAEDYEGGATPNGEADEFLSLSDFGEDVVRIAIDAWADVIAVDFVEVDGSSADIAIAGSSVPSTSWAYLPTSSSYGGDVWFGLDKYYNDLLVADAEEAYLGTYEYFVAMHELGHSLGLKHPTDTYTADDVVLSEDYDSIEYTVMSYKSYVGAGSGAYTVRGDSYPQSLMMLDIAAIQELYGADYSTNSDDTVYSFDEDTGAMLVNGVSTGTPSDNVIFRTIWDGDGVDTFDLSNYSTNIAVDLNAGGGIDLDVDGSTQKAWLGRKSAADIYASANVYMSLLYEGDTRSLIENVVTGDGDDSVIGNSADNYVGIGGGRNSFDGEEGTDTVYLDTVSAMVLVEYIDGTLKLGYSESVVELVDVEYVETQDGVFSIANVIAAWDANQATTVTGFIGLGLISEEDAGGITNEDALAAGGAMFAEDLSGQLAVGDSRYDVLNQASSVQGVGSHEISTDGTAITLTDNAWKSVGVNVTVTADTVLSFDFTSQVEGEIMAIAFVNGDTYDDATTFQLYGIDDWGIQDFNTYASADGTVHYEINVGDYFTGDFDRLVFIADDDAGLGSDATFANLSIETAAEEPDTDVVTDDDATTPGNQLLVDGSAYDVLNQATEDQGVGSHEISEDGTSITLTDNAWKSVVLDAAITADTVLSFDFTSQVEGEIMAISFVNGDAYDDDTTFQIYGNYDWGIQDYNTYTSADGTVHYDINVGDYFTGDFDRLVFIADDDAGLGSDATFSNISIDVASTDASPVDGQLLVDDFSYDVLDHASEDQGLGSHVISEDGTSITLTDNAWKSVALDTAITEDTVLSFDFTSAVEGEIMAISFVTGDSYSQSTTFQLYGTDDYGIQTYNTYDSADGTIHYDIVVGDYFTGDYDRLVFIADDDAGMGSDATFANISIGGAADMGALAGQLVIDDTAYSVTDHTVRYQGVGSHEVSEDHSAITLTDNAWKSVEIDEFISADTVLSFDFTSQVEGEIMGVAFVNGDTYDEDTTFQLYGTDDWGLQAFNTYDSADGTSHFEINVGDYFTGDYDRLVFIADDDAGMGSDATFANISIA